jgi:hypothetical protein
MSVGQTDIFGILTVVVLALAVFGGVTYLTRNWT